jgi:hypothetical protein
MRGHGEGLSTIIINMTPSSWSRPRSSHENISMHAKHARPPLRIFADILANYDGCYLVFRFGDVASQLTGYVPRDQ